jgi:hypothetical protein
MSNIPDEAETPGIMPKTKIKKPV